MPSRDGAWRLPGACRFVVLAFVVSGCQCAEPTGGGSPQPGGDDNDAGTVEPIVDKKDCVDLDGDGYGVGADCAGVDCDDADPALANAGVRGCYTGDPAQRDVGACASGTQTCLGGTWGDCHAETLPSAEVCDGVDNDCDGQTDEGLVAACYPGPGGTEGVGVCTGGVQTCVDGTWSACANYVAPQVETCDSLDNDCNGAVDEKLARYTQNGSDQAVLPKYQPVDIVFVIDNSSSMSDEIRAVEDNINTHFAEIIGKSGLDYRVIMLSQHGTGSAICIRSPLSGNGDCSQPTACPVNTDRFFHYNVPIGSFDSLSKIINTYNAPDSCGLAPGGWSAWLRPEAKKVLIEFTDDQPRTDRTGPNSWTAAMFESALFSLTPALFGTADARAYTFHSIVGLEENAPADSPWLATDPLITGLCTGNGGAVKNPGTEYQRLSVATGGLRYPICEFQSFDAIFRTVATGIVVGAQIACTFEVSSIPADTDLDNAYLELTPSSGGATERLTHVTDETSCSGNSFYTDGSSIILCPDSCTAWRADPTASIDVVFTCSSQLQP